MKKNIKKTEISLIKSKMIDELYEKTQSHTLTRQLSFLKKGKIIILLFQSIVNQDFL